MDRIFVFIRCLICNGVNLPKVERLFQSFLRLDKNKEHCDINPFINILAACI